MRTKVYRIDKTRADKFELNAQGFLQAPAFVTRVGVLKYTKPDGSVVREFRPPEEVFKEDSLKTLIAVPVTNDHPDRLVDSSNVKALAVGYIGDMIEVEDQFVKARTLTVYDAKTIEAIMTGKVEVSCGYEAELEESPGVYEGEEYDLVQRNIVYNHVAIVDQGRAGPQVRLRLDSNGAICEDMAHKLIGDVEMEKIKIGDAEFEVSPEMKKAFDAYQMDMQKKMDEMGSKQDAMVPKEELVKVEDEKKKELDSMQAKLDAALDENKKIKTDSNDTAKIHAAAVERMGVVKVAAHVLGKEAKLDSKSNMEIKREVLESKGIDVKAKSDEYVSARFDALNETIGEEIEAFSSLGEKFVTRTDGMKSPDEVRKENMEKSKNAWKSK